MILTSAAGDYTSTLSSMALATFTLWRSFPLSLSTLPCRASKLQIHRSHRSGFDAWIGAWRQRPFVKFRNQGGFESL